MIEFKFHFDGKAIVLDEPVALPVNTPLVAKVDDALIVNAPALKKERVWGQFKDQIWISPDFDEQLPDSFWGFDK